MFSNRGKSGSGRHGQGRELQKLRRQDLLELLVEQMRENDQLRSTIAEQERRLTDLDSLSERLKTKLDLKDEVIDRLKRRLDIKDAIIAEFMAQGREMPQLPGMYDLNELLEVEQRAVENYLLQNEDIVPGVSAAQLGLTSGEAEV